MDYVHKPALRLSKIDFTVCEPLLRHTGVAQKYWGKKGHDTCVHKHKVYFSTF